MLIERELVPENERVINFKLEWLTATGYNRKNAERIAKDPSIDWHFAVDLLRNCGDQRLCMRILRPGE
jgi:hypothetical protein